MRFVALFIGVYIFLSFLYSLYLNFSDNPEYFPDCITNLVARQSSALLNGLGYLTVLKPSSLQPGILLTIKDHYSVVIVEGCNAISVIILFISFVIAFAEKFKKTILFLIAGAVLIYAINLLRIIFLAIALYKYPEYGEVLHGVIFPAIIYGMVFILWIVWVHSLKTDNKGE